MGVTHAHEWKAGEGTVTISLRKNISTWIRRHRIGLGILFLFLLLFYGHGWLMTPTVNPHPTRKVVMRGEFPFDRGWELRIQQSFYTRNSLCKRTARVFFVIPQAEVSREKMLPHIVPKRLDGNRYEVEYYQDHFFPGVCEWTVNFTYYRIFNKDKKLTGGALLGFPNRYNKISYDCFMHTVPVNTPAKYESGLVCRKRINQHSFDSSPPFGEVNFFWKEKRP